MATVIYAHIPHQCGCRILLKERDKAPAAIRRLKDYRQPAMVLVAARDIRAEELAAVEEAGPHARAKLVVVHQSDELNTYNTTWYPKVRRLRRVAGHSRLGVGGRRGGCQGCGALWHAERGSWARASSLAARRSRCAQAWLGAWHAEHSVAAAWG